MINTGGKPIQVSQRIGAARSLQSRKEKFVSKQRFIAKVVRYGANGPDCCVMLECKPCMLLISRHEGGGNNIVMVPP